MSSKKAAAVAATALIAATLTLVNPAPAQASFYATAMAPTQRMMGPTLNTTQFGWFGAGTRVTLDCYSYGQPVKGYYFPNGWDSLWYRTPTGWVADVDLNTGSNNPVTEACPATTAVNYTGQIGVNTWLEPGAQITSGNGRNRLAMQTDGNLVAYWDGVATWSTGTYSRVGSHLILQGDSNLVLYQSGTALWASNTVGRGATRLAVQDDGNVVLYTSDGRAVWATNTVRLTTAPTTAITNFRNWALNPANWNSYTPAGNRGIDADGAYGAQCADLGIAWSSQAGRRVGFDGWDTSTKVKTGWHYVSGNLSQARAGDVITRVGGQQHVIVITANPTNGTVQSIQQNPGSPALANYSTTTTGVIWRLN